MNRLKELSKKKWFIFPVIVLSIALVGGLGTYAMFYWRSVQNTEITLKIGDIADVTFPDGQELNTNSLAPVFNYTDGETLSFSIQNKDQTNATIKYTVNFNITNIDEQLRNTSLKYKLLQGTTVVGEGDFSTATNNSTITLSTGNLPSGTSNYTFYIYIDSNEENNPNMMNRNIRGVVEVTAVDPSATLAGYIRTLYLTNKDSGKVTNNGIEYQYASSKGLMNDRLGGTTADFDGGNVRYYGADPDNYIDIGDRNSKPWENYNILKGMFQTSEQCYETFDCTTNYASIGALAGQSFTSPEQCEAVMPALLQNFGLSSIDKICSEQPILYRIIGVFDDNLKVIRNDRIGYYSWDTSTSETNNGYGINEWSQADLMKLLNPGHNNNQDLDNNGDIITVNNSLWWNSQGGTCYDGENNSTTNCDFTVTGLSEEAKKYIADNLWYLGGINRNTDINSLVNVYYAFERGNNVVQNPSDEVIRTTTWIGKVGLPYLSDYGYATDLSVCSETLNYYYRSSNCTDNDWLKSNYVTIVPDSSNATNYWDVGVNGGGVSITNNSSPGAVRPVLTLKANVERVSGSGTKEDPYRIK